MGSNPLFPCSLTSLLRSGFSKHTRKAQILVGMEFWGRGAEELRLCIASFLAQDGTPVFNPSISSLKQDLNLQRADPSFPRSDPSLPVHTLSAWTSLWAALLAL